ncbi:MAG: hypothetical protein F9B45_00865 [Phycisphaera sp. RhM]|nr:hypothetical protein [Phycisphaera sp. RhM]
MLHAPRRKRKTRRQRLQRRHRKQLHLELLEDRRLLAQVDWDGGGDGSSWTDPLNWSNDQLPTAADDVAISLPGDYSVVLSTDVSLQSLTVGNPTGTQTLRLNSSVLDVTAGSVEIETGATVAVTAPGTIGGDVVNHGVFEAIFQRGNQLTASSSVALTGAFTNAAGGMLRLLPGMNAPSYSNQRANLTVDFQNGLTNAGTIELSEEASSSDDAGNTTLRVSGGALNNQSTGVIESLVGGGVGTIGSRTIAGTINNDGTIQVIGQSLTLTGGTVTSASDITVDAGRTLTMSTGSRFNPSTGQVLGVGVFELRSGAELGDGTFRGRAYFHDATVPANATLVNAGELIFPYQVGNALTQSATRTIAGDVTNASGGVLRLLPGMNASSYSNQRATLTVDFQKGLTNAGVIELSEGPSSSDDAGNAVLLVSGGLLDNQATGVIESLIGGGTGTIGSRTIQGDLVNDGAITVERSLAQSGTNVRLENNNLISVSTGQSLSLVDVTLSNAANIELPGTASVSLSGGRFNPLAGQLVGEGAIGLSGGAELGTGTLAGRLIYNDAVFPVGTNFVNEGIIEVPYQIGNTTTQSVTRTFAGAFTNAAGSKLRLLPGMNASSYSNQRANLTVDFRSGLTNAGIIELSEGTSSSDDAGNTTLLISGGTLNNQATGVIQSLVGGGTGTIGSRTLTGAIENDGAIQVVSQNVTLNSGIVTNDGDITVDTGRTLTMSTGSRFDPSTGQLLGEGAFALRSGAELGDGTLRGRAYFYDANVPADATLINAGELIVPYQPGNTISQSVTRVFAGAFTNAAGGVLRLLPGMNASSYSNQRATLTVDFRSGLTNAGTIELSEGPSSSDDAGNTVLHVSGGTLTNEATGVIESLIGSGVGSIGSRSIKGTVLNNGTVNANEHSLTLTDVTFTNSAVLNAGLGKKITVGAGARLNPGTGELAGEGTFEVRSGGQLGDGTVKGSIRFLDGTVPADADLTNAGVIEFPHHYSNTAHPVATRTVAGAFTNAAEGILRLVPSINITNTTADTVREFIVDFQNGLTNAGTIELSEGSSAFDDQALAVLKISGGTLVNEATGQINSIVGGGFNLIGPRYIRGAIDNFGTIRVEKDLRLDTSPSNYANGRLDGGTYVLLDHLQFPNQGISTNAANLVLHGGARILDSGRANSLAGLATNEAAGSLELRDGANLSLGGGLTSSGDVSVWDTSTLSPSGNLLIESGTLVGNGSIAADVNNQGGTVVPADGGLTVTGAFAQSNAGTLQINLNGPPPDQFGFVRAGSASLDGTLNVTVADGYAPGAGDSFEILDYASRTGEFASFSGLDYAPNRLLTTDNTPTGYFLEGDFVSIRVEPFENLTVTEAGSSIQFSVILDQQPTAPVTIGISSSDESEGVVSADSVTFTPTDWTPKSVTVTGVDDFQDDGDVAFAIITDAAVSDDLNFKDFNPVDVSLVNQDDDEIGLVVTPPTTTQTTEAGGTTEFSVSLGSQPTAEVIVDVRSSLTREGRVSVEQLVFTPDNFNTPQTVVVTGQDDVLDDGDSAFFVYLKIAATDDVDYQSAADHSVALVNLDDDTAGFIWDGGGDGTTWHDPLNWGSDTVPTSLANVLIPDQPGEPTIVINQNTTIASIYSAEHLSHTNGRFTVSTGGIAASGLLLSADLVVGDSFVTQGPSEWSAGSVEGDSWVNEGTLQITGSTHRFLYGTINNTATVIHSATGQIRGFAGSGFAATVNNFASAVYDFQNGQLLTWTGTPQFNNEGILRKTTDNAATIGYALNLLDGSDVQVVGDNLFADGGGSFSGQYSVSQGVFRPSGGTFTLQDSSRGSGAGTLRPTGGELTVAADATATLHDLLWLDGGDTTGAGTLALTGQNQVTGGSLGGNVDNQGTLQWTGGDFDGVLTNSNQLEITGSAHRFLYGAINNAATVIHSANGQIRGIASGSSAAAVNNLAGAVYDFQNGHLLTWSGSPLFNNEGILRKTTDSVATIGYRLNLRVGSDVQVVGDNLFADGGGSFSGQYTISQDVLALSGGSFTLQDGSRGSGAGTLRPTGGELTVPTDVTATLHDLLWLDGGDTTGAGTLALTGENQVTGGSLGGNVDNQGTLQWTGGDFDGVLTNSNQLEITGPAHRFLYGILNNTATVIHSATGQIRGVASSGFAGIVNNLAGAVYDFQNGHLLTWSGSPLFNNEGILRKTTDNAATIGYETSNADGTFDIELGSLALTGSLTNFSNQRLESGRYIVADELRFSSADIQSNAATIELIAPGAAIRDTSGNNALRGFELNEADGTFAIADGANVTVPADFTNAGIVDVEFGSTFSVTGDFIQTGGETWIAEGGWIDPSNQYLLQGGSLEGNGIVWADTINSGGDVMPGFDGPGILTIRGNYTQAAGGSLTFDIAGTDVGTQHDRLGVFNSVTLDGTLNVDVASTFLPSRGDVFELITSFGNQTGNFTTFNGLTIDANRALVPVRGDATYSLASVVAGIKIEPLTGLQTTEAGGTATFTIELEDAPSAPVTFNLEPSDSGEGTLNVSSVSFDGGNWNVPQTVTITGVNDFVDDGDQPYSIITTPIISDDPLFSGLDPSDIPVINVDDDEVGLVVTAPSVSQTSEAGGTSEMSVALQSRPTADVVVSVTSNNIAEATVSPSSITFTPDSWNVARTVTITGQPDDVDDGDIPYLITVSIQSSADTAYTALADQTFALTNADDDTAGITVEALASSVTSEDGGTASFTLVLDSKPVSNVTLTVDSSDETEASVSPASHTFTPVNWNQSQTFTATGLDDLLDDGDVPYQITFTATTSGDPLYDGILHGALPAINLGTDTYELTLSNVDTSGLTYDPQLLTVSGAISATVANSGPIGTTGPIEVAFFEDTDLNGLFDAAVDKVLGSTTISDPITAGATVSVSATLFGSVLFVDNVIWGVVDTANAFAEIDELNNYARHECLAGTEWVDVSSNLGSNAITASGFYQTSVPVNAFDQDTSTGWNAGRFPPAWIEADLGLSQPLASVRLLPSQVPSTGTTTHEVWVSDQPIGTNRSNAVLAKRLTSVTTSGQSFQLDFDAIVSGRHVQIYTTSSPSWVSWTEIDVFAASGLPAPDLTASYIRTNAAGTSVDVVARVGNGGQVPTEPGVPVAFYDGDPSQGGVLLGTTSTTQRLNPGEFEDVTLTVPVGFSQLWVVADDDGAGNGTLLECDEDNNITFVEAAPRPDLDIEVVSAAATAQTSQVIPVTWRVSNNGQATAESPWADHVYLSTDQVIDASDTLLGQFTRTQVLAVAGNYDAQLDVTLPRDTFGDLFLLFATDVTGGIIELDELDNVAAAAITVTPAPTPDLVFASASISESSVQPAQDLILRWTIENDGDLATPTAWTDRIYLSTDGTIAAGIAVAARRHEQSLADGASRLFSQTFTVPDLADGDYHVVFVTDTDDELFERDGEANNVFVLPQTISVGHPDLTGAFINPPAEVVAGNSLAIDWSESQIGTAATLTGFTTRIYLSQNDQVDAGDVLLSERLETEVWQPGRTQDIQADVTIPIELSGSYFLLLSVDDGDKIYELGGEGNNLIASPITLTVPPHADLVASNVVSPTLVIGDPAAMTVSWTVANTGEVTTNSDGWEDSVVLSSDEIFGNGDDRVVGQLERNTSLPIGDRYDASVDLTLPAGLAGLFHVFVAADAQGDVFEDGKTANNVALAADKVEITPTPYADLVVSSVDVPPTASSGGLLEITWEVTNQGIGPTDVATWGDVIRLARNPDGTDLLRAFAVNRNDPTIAAGSNHFGVLDVDQSYRRTSQISLPNGLEGTFYVVVDTGTFPGVFEHRFGGNNRRVSSATNVTVAPSPDLIVEAITAPPEAKSGTKIDVEWTVRNTGDAAADGRWSDRLSLKSVGDPNASLIHLGIFQTSLTLDAGLSYTRAEQFTLSPELEGAFQVVVHSNFTGSLYEHAAAADNNVSEDDEIIVVSHPPRPDLQVTDIIAPTSVPAGGTISATYIVTNRGTETTRGRWKDRVYLSLDNKVTSDDIILGTFDNAAALNPDEPYQVSVDPYVVPKRFRGDVFVLVQTDFEDSIEETRMKTITSEPIRSLPKHFRRPTWSPRASSHRTRFLRGPRSMSPTPSPILGLVKPMWIPGMTRSG